MTTVSDILRSFPLQQKRFSHDIGSKKTGSKGDRSVERETVYNIHHLPDGFVADFEEGIFSTSDVSNLSDLIRERYKGKELRLVPLSELEGEAYYYNKSTGEREASLADPNNLFILLVENKDIPNGDAAKGLYFATQAIKNQDSNLKTILDFS